MTLQRIETGSVKLVLEGNQDVGLTQSQWQQLDEKLTPLGRQILDLRKAGNSIEVIAQQLKLKTHQVLGEWIRIYLAAQILINQE